MKDLLFDIFYPLVAIFVFLKHKNIWQLKQHLQQSKKPYKLLHSVYANYFYKRGSFVGLHSQLNGPLCLPHGPLGLFISDAAVIGKNVVIFQQVTIGSDSLVDSEDQGSPVIGDNVYIGAGAKIIGNVRIGDNCRIGANAVVYRDMPPHSVAVCASTRVLQRERLDNRYVTTFHGQRYCFQNGRYVRMRDEGEQVEK